MARGVAGRWSRGARDLDGPTSHAVSSIRQRIGLLPLTDLRILGIAIWMAPESDQTYRNMASTRGAANVRL